MDNNKKDFSNTMEIDAILEEARRNRTNTGVNATTKLEQTPITGNNAEPKRPEYSNDFVIMDDEAPTEKKKSKKAGVIVAIVAAVLVLLGAAGFCAYNYFGFGGFEYASNVYVNGIALGGLSEEEALKLVTAEETKLADEISITINATDKSLKLTKDDFKYTFNTEEVLKEAKTYSEENLVHTGDMKYTISIKVDDTDIASIVEKVSKEFLSEPANAVVTAFDSSKKGNDRFKIQDEVVGVEVDKDGFEHQIKAFLDSGNVSGTIDAKVNSVEPKYTKEFLLANIKKLSTFTTVSTNNSNGNANMKLSLSACNNSIINPGDVWSFNECTGDSNQTSRGYKSAGVIINGRSATGVGGGICQSSTTIYNATMMCGMEVVERECHYFKSDYVDAGRDATIDYGNIDLKVKNIFDYQLFMECYMDGTTLYCNMYGIENPEFDEIKISSSVTSHFSNGFRAETSRTYYLDGKKVKTESLPNSTYYTSSPGGSSGSSNSNSNSDTPKPTTKPTTKPSQGGNTTETTAPTPTPDPEPTPTPDPEPVPTPDPEPAPTPDPEPAPDNSGSAQSAE